MGKNGQKLTAFIFGVAFVITLIILAIAFPEPTAFQYMVFRIILALAAAGVGAMIPGFLHVNVSAWVRAGGALGVFAVVYFFNPAWMPKPVNNKDIIKPKSPPVGNSVFLDVSKGQSNWRGLATWADNSPLDILMLDKPFWARSFHDNHPGVLIHALPYKELLSDPNIALIRDWVKRGGGLLVLGYYAADTHHGSKVSELIKKWGVSFEDNLLMPNGASQDDTRDHVFNFGEKYEVEVEITSDEDLRATEGVDRIVLQSAASLNIKNALLPKIFQIETEQDAGVWRPEGEIDAQGMRLRITKWDLERTGSVPVLAGFKYGKGKVVVCGTWKIATLDRADNSKLIHNLIEWLRPVSD